jgi:hypothetical protein
VSVQTIAMDREEVSFSFNVTEISQAAVKTASNASFTFEGTEDTARPFSLADLSSLGNSVSIRAVQEVIVKSLPVDGVLQFEGADKTWRAVTLDQRITREEISAGRLRFVPDANESGASEYKSAGVGNMRDVYAEMEFELVAASAASDSATVTVQMEINPVIDNTQTVTGVVARVGSVAAAGAGTWGRYTFNVTGNIGDTDGSERTLIEVTPANRGTTFRVLTGTTYTTVTADAQGKIFLNPGQTLFVQEYSIGGFPGTSLQYKLIGQEVNSVNDVLATKDLVGSRSLQAVQPPPPPVYDPLILDLDGNGVKTSTVDDGVVFDVFANGTAVQVAWTDGIDGFLVLDRDGDGAITTGAEMFGDFTHMQDGTLAKDGFEALRDLDSNSDGLFDANDDLFDLVQVWVDGNRDGVSDASELFGLTELGIKSIQLTAQSSDRTENGNLYGLISKMTMTNGGEAEVVDVWLETQPLEVNQLATVVI